MFLLVVTGIVVYSTGIKNDFKVPKFSLNFVLKRRMRVYEHEAMAMAAADKISISRS